MRLLVLIILKYSNFVPKCDKKYSCMVTEIIFIDFTKVTDLIRGPYERKRT